MIRLAIALLVLGALFVGTTGPTLLKGFQARSWPTAEGKVTWSQVTVHRGGKGGPLYTPLVRYRFVAGGKERRSENLSIGSRSYRHEDDAEAVVRRHLVGQEVTVHYNPAQPKEGYLDISFSWQAGSIFVFGWLTLAAGVCVATRAWRDLHDGRYHRGHGL